jgi:hypothetical protein
VRVKSTTSSPSSNKKGKRGEGSNSSPFLVKKKKNPTQKRIEEMRINPSQLTNKKSKQKNEQREDLILEMSCSQSQGSYEGA